MNTFLEEIIAGLKDVNLDEMKEPDEKVGDFEKILGVAPEHAKRLWAMREKLAASGLLLVKELKDLAMNLKMGDTPPLSRIEELRTDLQSITDRIDILNGHFWNEVRRTFKVWGKDVGLRKGWQVVLTPPSQSALPFPFSALFGG